MELTFTSQEIRDMLINAHKIKRQHKCYMCNGTGYVNGNEDGEDVRPGYSDKEGRNTEECEDCDGVGYTDLTIYTE